jgi:hypothetical protein
VSRAASSDSQWTRPPRKGSWIEKASKVRGKKRSAAIYPKGRRAIDVRKCASMQPVSSCQRGKFALAWGFRRVPPVSCLQRSLKRSAIPQGLVADEPVRTIPVSVGARTSGHWVPLARVKCKIQGNVMRIFTAHCGTASYMQKDKTNGGGACFPALS